VDHIPERVYHTYVKAPGDNYTHSMRSPFLMIVSGFAIFPLIVVTPDSNAYL